MPSLAYLKFSNGMCTCNKLTEFNLVCDERKAYSRTSQMYIFYRPSLNSVLLCQDAGFFSWREYLFIAAP